MPVIQPRAGSGRDPTPPPQAPAASVVTLAALRVGDLLAHDELSCGQLARRLDLDPDRLSDLLDEAEELGLVRWRAGRYTLTRAGESLRSGRTPAAPRTRRTTWAGAAVGRRVLTG